jgi:hypothetical protein
MSNVHLEIIASFQVTFASLFKKPVLGWKSEEELMSHDTSYSPDELASFSLLSSLRIIDYLLVALRASRQFLRDVHKLIKGDLVATDEVLKHLLLK